MPVPDWQPGMIITASRLREMQTKTVSQVSDLTINNTTTFQNTNLVIPLVAGATYRFEVRGNYHGSSAADIKFNWTLPAGADIQRIVAGPGSTSTGGAANFTTTAWRRLTVATDLVIGAAGAGTNVSFFEVGLITVGVTAGNATFVAAQQSADVSDTVFTAQSFLDYIRLS